MRSKEGLGSFSIDSGVCGHEDALSGGCVEQCKYHEANCCPFADAGCLTTLRRIVRLFSQHGPPFLLFIADCRIMSKNARPVSFSRLSRTPKVMPTLGWKPEANDVIIPCVITSNLLGCSLILNISQINGPDRCRKKHSKSFMLQYTFSLNIHGSSSSISSQERR